MQKRLAIVSAIVVMAATTMLSSTAGAATAFSNTPLFATWTPPPGLTTSPLSNSSGDSEPAIAFGQDGSMAVDGLGWLPFQVNLWKGTFGSTPAYFGAMDTNLPIQGRGRTNFGDDDADVEITAAGTTLLADLDVIVNAGFNNAQLGVSVTRCPTGSTGPPQPQVRGTDCRLGSARRQQGHRSHSPDCPPRPGLVCSGHGDVPLLRGGQPRTVPVLLGLRIRPPRGRGRAGGPQDHHRGVF